jgi:hypothetical protein
MTVRRWLAVLIYLFCVGAGATEPPSIALFYGRNAPLDELRAFDIAVVEPGHGYDPVSYRTPHSELFAYVSVGEVHPTRPYFQEVPQSWRLAANEAWGAVVVDQTQPDWPGFFAERVVAPLWQAGYRGLFLDTLDSYRLAGEKADAAAQQRGLIEVVRTLRSRFPGIRLIANRGFELLPMIKGELIAVAAESLFRGWDARAKRYVEVSEADRSWLLGQLNTAREAHALPVLAIDYVAPADRDLARETAARIRALGFAPWVCDGALESLGIGAVEVVPRRVMVLYDGRDGLPLIEKPAHRFIAMPLQHLGYIPEYVDVQRPLPDMPLPGRYSAVVTWFTDTIDGARAHAVSNWLRRQVEAGMRLAVLGQFGFALDAATAAGLDLRIGPGAASGRLTVASRDAMMEFEAAAQPDRGALVPLQVTPGATARALLQLEDARGNRFDVAALTRWGGYVLDPFAAATVTGLSQDRWIVDPFAFLMQALRLSPMPVPDTTTENGRRLLLVHIDGDGFASRAEFPGSPFASEVLLREVLEKYRIPTTMSVIEAEVGKAGIYKDLSPRLETIARKMFALPHVEIASHTYSHPFDWAKAEAKANPDSPDAYFALKIPDYEIDVWREIIGSADYINRELAPPGKKAVIILWSGDARPGERSLRIAREAGLFNMNGGSTSITRSHPSLTTVFPLGVHRGELFQVYAPIINENVYTNDWRGPFYGFARVIETFEMTDQPRRLKPINIYYHTYSASKRAGIRALHKVYNWALAQPVHAVHASEFIRKVLDFNRMVIARAGDAWLIRGGGDLRTLRLPAALGVPDMARSRDVAGHAPAAEGNYVHLAGDVVLLRLGESGTAAPFLVSANARLTSWQWRADRIDFSLKGHQPLELTLANVGGCRVSSDNKPLIPRKTERGLAHFQLRHAAAAFQVSCRDA